MPSISLTKNVVVTPYAMSFSSDFLAIFCSMVAPGARPLAPFTTVSNLDCRNLGANRSNSPIDPPVRLVLHPVILLTIEAIFSASPESMIS